jgi:hypothetical protein
VVRARKIALFPGGTDAFDVARSTGEGLAARHFLERQGEDEERSVEAGAHFYHNFMLDGAGNHVNKRNAWQARSLLYVRLIPLAPPMWRTTGWTFPATRRLS